MVTLRSIIAILLGLVVMVGGYVVTTIVFPIFNYEDFKPGVQLPTERLLVSLAVSAIWSVIGGFAVGVIARRKEIEHAIGLVVFTSLLSLYFVVRNRNSAQVPDWYLIAGQVLMVLSVLLGGWLRMKRGTLLNKMPKSVVRTVDEARLSIGITVDQSRPLMAAIVACVTFITLLFLGVVFGTAGIAAILRMLFDEDYSPTVPLPVFIASLVFSSVLSRRVYRRIMAQDASLMNGRRQQ